MAPRNKQTPKPEEYSSIMRKESKSQSVASDSKIESLLNELIEDYIAGKVVRFNEGAPKPNANRKEEAAKAIKDLLDEHGIRKSEGECLNMAETFLHAIDKLSSSDA
ncbi:MAG: hypothetical protein LVQ97_05285 [Candidatus Micrarchaeales archaeon]|jgi:hypothetical protein|uniref:Uncharacterized protein n=1 Tax=Candidatus Micrarchaeum acidiphilum ARMAN-2 TaxID=425595 RepID=C7DG69_MICA2|nr:MAG: hypothetical protein UNLARM2_1011 [Candidatus Micrarchaeum acidiphilum ARMAN-2]MCW6161571.1 hypothetical protein [Candidatus Micrarchaeales archaeon]